MGNIQSWEDESVPEIDNEDEFDIYSDIDETPLDKVDAARKTDSTETTRTATIGALLPYVDKAIDDCGDDHDSDLDDMVICEELDDSIPVGSRSQGRRPEIHFPIRTRHQPLPLGSLIKRQKWITKTETRVDGGCTIDFQSEISKAFSSSENDAADQKDEQDEDENLPKISLVADIFGSDEEEEADEVLVANVPTTSNGQETPEEQKEETVEQITKAVQAAIDTSSGLWKTLSAEPEPVEPPVVDQTPKISHETQIQTPQVANPLPTQGSEGEPKIIEIVTINAPPHSFQPCRYFRGQMSRELETIPDSDGAIEDINMVNKEEQRTPAEKPKERNRSRSKSKNSSRSRSPADHKRRERKQCLSVSSDSDFEEGEIIDDFHENESRKGDKERKIKKQQPLKDRLGAKAPTETNYKNQSGLHSNISSDEDNRVEDENVVWKRPSKRSHDVNLRGAKNKSEHSANHEKEKEPEENKSPASRRHARGSASPYRRAGPAYRRSHSRLSDRFSRSHFGYSWNRNKRKPSRPGSSNSYDSPRSGQRRHHHRHSTSPSHRLGHSRSPSKSPEPIRSRASHVSKGSKRRESAGSRGRDKAHRSRKPRKSTLSRSRSPPSVSKVQRKIQKHSKSVDTHKKRKAKLKKDDLALTLKSKRRAKERLKEKEKRKLAQKAKEGEKQATKVKTAKEKGEKKKRKREKSLSPVKAIVAYGDSIIVSLSFQKDPPAPSEGTSDKGTSGKENKSSKKLVKHTSEPSKYKESSSSRSPTISKKIDFGADDLSSVSEYSNDESEMMAS